MPGAINVQPPGALGPMFGGSRPAVQGQSLSQLASKGDAYVIAENTNLPFANGSIDRVITNSVPIDKVTPMGPGVQSSEVWRILKPGGEWINNGRLMARQ